MSVGKVNPTQKIYYLQTGVILQKCVILPLKRFELPSFKVMLQLRGVKLQLGLKPLRRNLTHSVYSAVVWSCGLLKIFPSVAECQVQNRFPFRVESVQ